MPHPTEFARVTVVCKANVYFAGKVVSHSVLFADGTKKTIGLIYPGEYHFNTDAPEKMEITAGQCRVKLAGQPAWATFKEGQAFNVPGKSGFDIAVEPGTDAFCQYICSFG